MFSWPKRHFSGTIEKIPGSTGITGKSGAVLAGRDINVPIDRGFGFIV
jgi:hypothetical protein